MKRLTSLGILLLWASAVIADPVSVNQRPRMQSMGGAGLALEGDKDSAVINPAGLADIEEPEWQIFPLLVELPFNTDAFSKALDYEDVRSSKSSTDLEKREALDKFAREVSSSAIGARVNFYPSYTRKFFHAGIFVDAIADSNLRINGFTSNQIAESGDTAITVGGIFGGAYSFYENSLQVGLTLKPMMRNSPFQRRYQKVSDIAKGLDPDQSVSDALFGDDASGRNAFAFGVDLGMKYWIQDYGLGSMKSFVERWRPAVGLTYQDVGNTRFFTDDEMPEDIPQSISLGAAVHPRWRFVEGRIALDFRNINEQQEFLNMFHFGSEAVLWGLWAIRFGVSQGYFVGGMGLDLPFFETDIYVAAEESAEYAHNTDLRTLGIRLSANF